MTANVIQLRETCHSEAVTDVTAVGIRIQNVGENGLPRQSADWLAMTKPLTEWHCCDRCSYFPANITKKISLSCEIFKKNH